MIRALRFVGISTLLAGVMIYLLGHPSRGDVSSGAHEDPAIAGVVNRMFVLLAKGDSVYAAEDHFIFLSTDAGRTFRQLGRLPKPEDATVRERLRDALARARSVRALRGYVGPRTLVALSSGTLLVFYDRIYRSVDGGRTFEIVPGTRPGVDIPGIFPGPSAAAVGPGDTLYFGEYNTQARPQAPRVIRGTEDGTKWEVAYQFPPGHVFHVHAVAYDEYRGGYWIATGDRGDEARLAFTGDDFESVVTMGCCTQDWRVVDMVITPTALYWGSDDDERSPGIFRWVPGENAPLRLEDLPNPSYSAARLADGSMAVATTYEPQSPLRAVSPGNAYASLFWSRTGETWTEVLRLPADPAAVAAGGRPQIHLPHGDPLPELLVSPLHTEGHHDDVLTVVRPPR